MTCQVYVTAKPTSSALAGARWEVGLKWVEATHFHPLLGVASFHPLSPTSTHFRHHPHTSVDAKRRLTPMKRFLECGVRSKTATP